MALAELLVAAVLSTFLVAAGTGVFVSATKTMRATAHRTAATADLRIAMERVTREVRVAVPVTGAAALVRASGRELGFYALLDRSGAPVAADADLLPTLVEYRFDGSCLTVTATPSLDPAGSPDTGRARSACILRTTVPPEFTFYRAPAPGDIGAGMPIAVEGELSMADLVATRGVEIRLTASAPAGIAPAAHLVARVTLVNEREEG